MLNFDGTILRVDGWVPVEIEISEPLEGEEGDFYCSIYAPPILSKRTRIFGVDAKQARELSIEFLDKLVGENELRDSNRRSVKLRSLI